MANDCFGVGTGLVRSFSLNGLPSGAFSLMNEAMAEMLAIGMAVQKAERWDKILADPMAAVKVALTAALLGLKTDSK
jgi:hydrogenase/urease accessory protein HupE